MNATLNPHELPPGYPKEYQREEVLRDERRVFIRPIVPADAPELAEAIRNADRGTIRGCFLGGPPRVTAARYEPVSEGVAKIAVAAKPEWRRAGWGKLLITLLPHAAAERGVSIFSASYLAENRPATVLVEDAGGLGGQVIKQGIGQVSLALDHRQPTVDPRGKAT
jgi:GNAT superfamily N-acetyltransferase